MANSATLWECLVERRVGSFDLGNADCIIGLAFGQTSFIWHDRINGALAEKVVKVQRTSGLKIVLQEEIAHHLNLNQVSLVLKPRKGEYLDTYGALRQAHNAGYRRPVLVAHPDHAWRVFHTARAIGFDVRGVKNTSHIGYDKDSLQRWTRSSVYFLPYDRLARLKYKMEGKI